MIRRIVLAVIAILPVAGLAMAGRQLLSDGDEPAAGRHSGGHVTAEMTVHSRYSMEGAYRVLISGSGVTGQVEPTIRRQSLRPATAASHATREGSDRREDRLDSRKKPMRPDKSVAAACQPQRRRAATKTVEEIDHGPQSR